MAPRKNLPDSGVNSEPGGCYATPAQLNLNPAIGGEQQRREDAKKKSGNGKYEG